MVVGLNHPQYEHENEACTGILGQYCILFVNPGLYGGLKEADTTNEPPYLESFVRMEDLRGRNMVLFSDNLRLYLNDDSMKNK